MIHEIIVYEDGRLVCGDKTYRCALGPNGVTSAAEKKGGDGCTPGGSFPLREVFYRADRLEKPETLLPVRELRPTDGWCDAGDDPANADPMYNQLVTLPYPASHEELWREDHVYDIIVPLGYNDDPAVPGRGSAIFFHIAREGYTPTAGCVAVSLPDMLEILAVISSDAVMTIKKA